MFVTISEISSKNKIKEAKKKEINVFLKISIVISF